MRVKLDRSMEIERKTDEMEILLKMMTQYPLLSTWDSNTRWTGFILVNNEMMRITIKVPKYPLMTDGDILGDDRTQMLCKPFSSQIKDLFSNASCNLITFLEDFIALLKSSGTFSQNELTTGRIDDQFYTILMKELEEIGVDKIVHMSDDYREIHIKINSRDSRGHVIKYQLPSKYPNVPLKINVELPVVLDNNLAWPNRIIEANRQIAQQMSRFNAFWDEMDNFDSIVRVIEPLRPSRQHCYRRVMLTERVNMHLEVNPLKPKCFPEVTFTGPEKLVDQFESMLGENCKKWNEENSILENLEVLLETEFLQKEDGNMAETDDSMKCTVCLNFELGDSIPERRCECGAQYHNKCLYDLFMSEFSTSVKRSVDCPVCEMELKILVIPE